MKIHFVPTLDAKDLSLGANPDQIEVAYDPERPDRVDVAATEEELAGAGRTWFVPGALVSLVALAVAAAWLLLVIIVWTS